LHLAYKSFITSIRSIYLQFYCPRIALFQRCRGIKDRVCKNELLLYEARLLGDFLNTYIDKTENVPEHFRHINTPKSKETQVGP